MNIAYRIFRMRPGTLVTKCERLPTGSIVRSTSLDMGPSLPLVDARRANGLRYAPLLINSQFFAAHTPVGWSRVFRPRRTRNSSQYACTRGGLDPRDRAARPLSRGPQTLESTHRPPSVADGLGARHRAGRARRPPSDARSGRPPQRPACRSAVLSTRCVVLAFVHVGPRADTCRWASPRSEVLQAPPTTARSSSTASRMMLLRSPSAWSRDQRSRATRSTVMPASAARSAWSARTPRWRSAVATAAA